MLNWWLIVLLILVILLCVGLSVYLLFYFTSEEDDGEAYGAKVIVVLGMVISMGVVLLLPLDVSNSVDPTIPNKYINTLNMTLMWQIVLWILFSMTFIIVPFVMFYYEAYDPDYNRIRKQIIQAILYTIGILSIFFIICGICYTFIGIAIIPVLTYEGLPQLISDMEWISYNGTGKVINIEIPVHFFTYCVGIMCFLGWIAFLFYGGLGIISFPLDLIFGFIKRTKSIHISRFKEEMNLIALKSDILLELSLNLQKKCRGIISISLRNKIHILRNETYLLEAQQEQLIWAYTKAGGSPFIIYGRLLLGIMSLCISILWILHIFIYNTFHKNLFLNQILISINNIFELFGIIIYGIFIFYLIWISFEGQVRLGMRLIFFQIYPLKPHDTTLNALLFNISISLLISPAIIEFASRSFQEYGPRTTINALMNIYVLHLKGIGIFIRWADVCFAGISLLAVLWVLLCPVHKRIKDPTKLRL
ncbi:hypothetical protein C3747_137g87 [Trypanosoma cruzi]|uniref:LMBR1-like membrane protein n=2 Tax=Trypanosoma cruzi TaxID=5693 RepID=Q4CQJ4_TRYCC|nr:hypothetical protein, conserved [Trypanosoma cruzi]EAN82546.1 hypothetical protein, conserved [Trypanosoma cruzi]PWV05133.1 hypothetical protein C3747_137g87 [Trypanosoma cruzi]|eukprot:XP_804397.1 hypothetical protein [Trypanosoma cruzi strain CL Brener]